MKRLVLTLAAAAALAAPLAIAGDAAAQPRHHHDRYDRRDRYDRHDRWDHSRYNGYYYGGRWSWGPPPAGYYGRPGFRAGWRHWERGTYLPPYYRSYVVYDWGRYRLRPPPRGYHWVRVNDDYILASIATGLIMDVLTR